MLTVYSKNHCPYCVQAKQRLSSLGIEYEEINIEENTEARDFIISEGHRTMPQIYNKDKLFVEGGAQGLAKLSKEQINEKLVDFSDFKL